MRKDAHCFSIRNPSILWPLPYPGESEAHFARRIRGRYRDLPEAYHLHRIRWQVMGHFTFEWLSVPARRQREMFHATMRTVCKEHRVFFPKVFWALRAELGTRKDLSPHLHFLIAALPAHIDLETFCRDCEAAWLSIGGGICKVTPFDRRLDGAGYVAKCADEDSGLADGDCGLTFSDAARAFLRRVVKRERGV